MVVTDVRNILTADSAVTALVADRIEPVRLDQATGLPAVVVTLISTVPANTLTGGRIWTKTASSWTASRPLTYPRDRLPTPAVRLLRLLGRHLRTISTTSSLT